MHGWTEGYYVSRYAFLNVTFVCLSLCVCVSVFSGCASLMLDRK